MFQIVVAKCKRKVGVATSVISTFKYILFLFSVSSFYVLFLFCCVYCWSFGKIICLSLIPLCLRHLGFLVQWCPIGIEQKLQWQIESHWVLMHTILCSGTTYILVMLRAWVNRYSLLICATGSWMWISCGAHSLLICATGVQMWISSGASPMNTEPDQSFKLILNLSVQVQRESLWENNWLPALLYLQSWRGPVLCIFQEFYKQCLLLALSCPWQTGETPQSHSGKKDPAYLS